MLYHLLSFRRWKCNVVAVGVLNLTFQKLHLKLTRRKERRNKVWELFIPRDHIFVQCWLFSLSYIVSKHSFSSSSFALLRIRFLALSQIWQKIRNWVLGYRCKSSKSGTSGNSLNLHSHSNTLCVSWFCAFIKMNKTWGLKFIHNPSYISINLTICFEFIYLFSVYVYFVLTALGTTLHVHPHYLHIGLHLGWEWSEI